MKKIKQFVFCGPGHANNYPKDVNPDIKNYTNPWTTNLFANYGLVSHLGIQGAPDTSFCLNDSVSDHAITIGSTGIYEIDLEGVGYITSLRFIQDKLLANYPETDLDNPRKLIVDIVYEEEG